MLIHVLLFQSGQDDEGIHSLEVNEKTIVLMFEDKEDAERYCGLLEAQDFPKPSIEVVERSEIESFCKQADYEARFVEKGFIPNSQEDRFLLSPPQSNLDVAEWDQKGLQKEKAVESQVDSFGNDNLEKLKKRLEDLI
tara:strand:+ start:1840 stop:2253 length:414 start_codon:yes stop_codon:yes gene_type:complete